MLLLLAAGSEHSVAEAAVGVAAVELEIDLSLAVVVGLSVVWIELLFEDSVQTEY